MGDKRSSHVDKDANGTGTATGGEPKSIHFLPKDIEEPHVMDERPRDATERLVREGPEVLRQCVAPQQDSGTRSAASSANTSQTTRECLAANGDFSSKLVSFELCSQEIPRTMGIFLPGLSPGQTRLSSAGMVTYIKP